MIEFSAQNLNFKDTLDCGQIFRFKPFDGGFIVFSLGECAILKSDEKTSFIDCTSESYFSSFFDLAFDYSAVAEKIKGYGFEKLTKASSLYPGLRILRQDKTEALFSFIISQNNNIPRIKSTIEKTCDKLGETKIFKGIEYKAFPTVEAFASKDEDFFKSLGYGYRAEYILNTARLITDGKLDLSSLDKLPTPELKSELLKIKGVGDKVADCALFFGFHRSDAFPVDTWIEKLYREDFNGTLTDRKKISKYFTDIFKENSGYVQQYLFYAKRNGTL
ncbi:MAG TPA: 8-oxoguanine DNA glycosylase [Clostridiales bacterium]|nr:8-oxoguanine DNA glycosylase [Clostridiales bacterium]